MNGDSITGEDTSDFTDVSINSTSTEKINESINSNPTCSYDKLEGVYGTPFSVTITCSEAATIRYCTNFGAAHCDPLASPILYTVPIPVNSGDNTYGISFYAEFDDAAFISPVTDLTYILNTIPPALIVSFPKINIQTSQLPFTNNTQSTDFGLSNHYYHQINFKEHDPTASGLNWSCSDMLNNHGTLTTPSVEVIQSDYDVSGLLITDQIDQSVDMPKLVPGDNYIVTILEDRARNLSSCQTQNIQIADFFISQFTATGSTPTVSGIRTTSGGFVGLGHFQAVPNNSDKGSSENTQSTRVNKKNIFNIIH